MSDVNRDTRMRRRLRSLIIVPAVVLAAYFGNVQVQTCLGKKALADTHLTSMTMLEAEGQAQRRSQNILVDVFAIWCPTCRRLDQEVFAKPSVRQYLDKHYAFVRLEYESAEGQAFLKAHNDVGFPDLWVLDARGAPIQKLQLTMDPVEFVHQLRKVDGGGG